MLELDIKDLSIAFGNRTLFSQADLSVYTSDKLGLIGANGCGKTTLLRTILGAEPDQVSGSITLARGLSVGYLAQQQDLPSYGTVLEIATEACRPILDMETQLEHLTHCMATASGEGLDAINEKYYRLQLAFEQADGYSVRSKILGVLRGIGLGDEFFSRPCTLLSGGEKARLSIARLLLSNHDILLLDEPTNHLDLRAAQWLTDFLCGLKTTVLVVSHDRYLLDRLCTGIAEIVSKRLIYYKGNYTDFRAKTDEQKRQMQKQYDEQQLEIQRQQEIIRQYHAFNREKSVRAARSREKALERMELVEAPEHIQSMRLHIRAGARTGNEVLTCQNLAAGYPGNTLVEADINIISGSKICLVGDNGCGKTTLLKTLLGNLPCKGSIKWGSGVILGYYAQQQEKLDPENTVLDEIWLADRKLSQTEVRSAAAAMLFTGENVFKKISTLSGGEKARVALCKLALLGCNVLIMDEPTNHLDMPSREVLEDALSEFPGTLICVSHDRYFINRIASELWELKDTRITRYKGNYDTYLLATTKNADLEAQVQVNKTAEAKKRAAQRQQRQQNKEAKAREQALEKEIAALEEQIAQLETLFAGTELYTDTALLLEKQTAYDTTKSQLDALYEQWLLHTSEKE